VPRDNRKKQLGNGDFFTGFQAVFCFFPDKTVRFSANGAAVPGAENKIVNLKN